MDQYLFADMPQVQCHKQPIAQPKAHSNNDISAIKYYFLEKMAISQSSSETCDRCQTTKHWNIYRCGCPRKCPSSPLKQVINIDDADEVQEEETRALGRHPLPSNSSIGARKKPINPDSIGNSQSSGQSSEDQSTEPSPPDSDSQSGESSEFPWQANNAIARSNVFAYVISNMDLAHDMDIIDVAEEILSMCSEKLRAPNISNDPWRYYMINLVGWEWCHLSEKAQACLDRAEEAQETEEQAEGEANGEVGEGEANGEVGEGEFEEEIQS